MKLHYNAIGVFTFLLVTVSILYAANVIKDGPTAWPVGDNIVLQWTTEDESNVTEFQIWRSSGADAGFLQIATVAKKGSNSQYTYEDQSVFKTSASFYRYKVLIVYFNQTTSETSIISVSHLSSTARRTWGSIKAMFR